MKRALFFLLFVSAELARAQAVAPNPHTADEQSIRSLNQTALKAYNLGDLKTLERIEDADFTLAGDFGQVSKLQQFDQVRQRKENASKVDLTVEKEHFRFYGDTALLTEVEKYGDPTNPAGFQTTSVWVRRAGEWKVVHLHFSSLGKNPRP